MTENIINCEYFKSKIDDFLADRLRAEERKAFLYHKEECEKCSQLLVEAEPSLIFFRLTQQKMPHSFWQGFWPTVKEGIEKRPFITRWFLLNRRLSHLAALSFVMLLIISVSIWFYFSSESIPIRKIEEPAKISFKLSANQREKITKLRAQYPTIEHLENQDARLYNFKIEDEVEVVMIFDENINGEK